LRLHLGYIDKELGATAQLPAIGAFLQRIHARPAYQRALERGGKYEILGGD
jgi:glutathione S-transferase